MQQQSMPGIVSREDHEKFFRDFFLDENQYMGLSRLNGLDHGYGYEPSLHRFEPYITSKGFSELARKRCPKKNQDPGREKFFLRMSKCGIGRTQEACDLLVELFANNRDEDEKLIRTQVLNREEFYCVSILCWKASKFKDMKASNDFKKRVALGTCVYKIGDGAVQITWLGRKQDIIWSDGQLGEYDKTTKPPNRNCPEITETGMSKLFLQLASVHGMLKMRLGRPPYILLQVNKRNETVIKIYKRLGFEHTSFHSLRKYAAQTGYNNWYMGERFLWFKDTGRIRFWLMTNRGNHPIESPYSDYRWYLPDHPEIQMTEEALNRIGVVDPLRWHCCAGEHCYYRTWPRPDNLTIPNLSRCMYCDKECHLQCLLARNSEDEKVFKFVDYQVGELQFVGVCLQCHHERLSYGHARECQQTIVDVTNADGRFLHQINCCKSYCTSIVLRFRCAYNTGCPRFFHAGCCRVRCKLTSKIHQINPRWKYTPFCRYHGEVVSKWYETQLNYFLPRDEMLDARASATTTAMDVDVPEEDKKMAAVSLKDESDKQGDEDLEPKTYFQFPHPNLPPKDLEAVLKQDRFHRYFGNIAKPPIEHLCHHRNKGRYGEEEFQNIIRRVGFHQASDDFERGVKGTFDESVIYFIDNFIHRYTKDRLNFCSSAVLADPMALTNMYRYTRGTSDDDMRVKRRRAFEREVRSVFYTTDGRCMLFARKFWIFPFLYDDHWVLYVLGNPKGVLMSSGKNERANIYVLDSFMNKIPEIKGDDPEKEEDPAFKGIVNPIHVGLVIMEMVRTVLLFEERVGQCYEISYENVDLKRVPCISQMVDEDSPEGGPTTCMNMLKLAQLMEKDLPRYQNGNVKQHAWSNIETELETFWKLEHTSPVTFRESLAAFLHEIKDLHENGRIQAHLEVDGVDLSPNGYSDLSTKFWSEVIGLSKRGLDLMKFYGTFMIEKLLGWDDMKLEEFSMLWVVCNLPLGSVVDFLKYKQCIVNAYREDHTLQQCYAIGYVVNESPLYNANIFKALYPNKKKPPELPRLVDDKH